MTTLLVVLDVETTGLSDKDDVIQVASILHEEGSDDSYTYMEFAKPSVPIHPKAQETHGISADQLKDCFPSETVVRTWWHDVQEFGAGQPIVFAGHNIQYDVKMLSKYLPGAEFEPSICTLQIARRTLNAPRYTLDHLYPTIGVQDPRADKAHDALADCWRCFHLLSHFCEKHHKTYLNLALHYSQPQRVEKMPFGKYKGYTLNTVDRGYLRWLIGQGGLDRDLEFSVKEVLRGRK